MGDSGIEFPQHGLSGVSPIADLLERGLPGDEEDEKEVLIVRIDCLRIFSATYRLAAQQYAKQHSQLGRATIWSENWPVTTQDAFVSEFFRMQCRLAPRRRSRSEHVLLFVPYRAGFFSEWGPY